jgi:hypothetical protein
MASLAMAWHEVLITGGHLGWIDAKIRRHRPK